MAKQLELEARTYSPYSKWSFYRPHLPVRYTGHIVDHVTGEITSPPSRTKQDFKDQCDINNIIKAYKITGQITHISANAQRGMYADMPDEADFQTAQNIIRKGTEAFASLPSAVRARFGNDPAAFLDFLNDPDNKDEAKRLGLLKPQEGGSNTPPPPPPPPAAPPPAPDAPKT